MQTALYKELASLSLLQGVSQTHLKWLMRNSSVKAFVSGDIILDPGQANDTLYMVLSGRLKIILRAEDRTEAYIDAGKSVGEMSVIDGTFPSAIVVADTEVRLLCINARVLWELIEKSHTVARNLLLDMSARIRRDNDIIVESTKRQNYFADTAMTDSLTRLRNRRWLDDQLMPLLEQCAHHQQPASLLMMDIDHFKIYNDTHGHLAGDRALQVVAQSLKHNLRPIDIAARYGGEEFVAVLPNIQTEDASQIAHRLCGAIRAQEVRDDNGNSLPSITVSIGLASVQSGELNPQLLAAADAALYRAKAGGRDQVHTSGVD